MKLTRCAEHMSFIYAWGLRPALYKGLHATAARLVQKVVAGTGSGKRALQVKLTKMLNVPGGSPECHLRSQGGQRQAK